MVLQNKASTPKNKKKISEFSLFFSIFWVFNLKNEQITNLNIYVSKKAMHARE